MMNRDEGIASAGFAVGVLTGVVMGAGLALLFAPKTGRDLRHDLGESTGHAREALVTRYRTFASKAETSVDRAVAAVEPEARQFAERESPWQTVHRES